MCLLTKTLRPFGAFRNPLVPRCGFDRPPGLTHEMPQSVAAKQRAPSRTMIIDRFLTFVYKTFIVRIVCYRTIRTLLGLSESMTA